MRSTDKNNLCIIEFHHWLLTYHALDELALAQSIFQTSLPANATLSPIVTHAHTGYGNRVAGRKHFQDTDHPGFALDLGTKDVNLVLDTAAKSGASMPLGELLASRLALAQSMGLGDLDWSATALTVSKESGVDVQQAIDDPQPE